MLPRFLAYLFFFIIFIPNHAMEPYSDYVWLADNNDLGLPPPCVFYRSRIQARIDEGLKGDMLISALESEGFSTSNSCYSHLIEDGSTNKLLDVFLLKIAGANNTRAITSRLLKEAVRLENIPAAKILINYGADVNYQVANQDQREGLAQELTEPPLLRTIPSHTIISDKKISLLKLLLSHHATPNIAFDGHTALTRIAMSRNITKGVLEAVRLLITAGADLTIKCTSPGTQEPYTWFCTSKTAVEIACGFNRPELLGAMGYFSSMRSSLFTKATAGETIGLQKPQELPLRQVKDAAGNNLLFYILSNIAHPNNVMLARKLLCLWPELLEQPNFSGHTILADPDLRNAAMLVFIRYVLEKKALENLA